MLNFQAVKTEEVEVLAQKKNNTRIFSTTEVLLIPAEAIIVSLKSGLLMRQQQETGKEASKTDIPSFNNVNTLFTETILSHWMTKKILGWQIRGNHGKGFTDPENINFLLGSLN